MSNSHALKHIHIEAFRTDAKYSPPKRDLSQLGVKRLAEIHGRKLSLELKQSLSLSRKSLIYRDQNIAAGLPGVYLEVEGVPGEKLPDLNWHKKNIRLGAVQVSKDGAETGTLFVPSQSEDFLLECVAQYSLGITIHKKPKHASKFDPLEFIRPGNLESLWTDARPIPAEEEMIWWECWVWADRRVNLLAVAARIHLRVSGKRLYFPEVEILPIFANAEQMRLLLQNTDAIEELRRASDSPSFFTRTERANQNQWVGDLVGRVKWPTDQDVAVTILDGGVANSHPLLNGALSAYDCFTVNNSWGTDDHEKDGHGTNMAGAILYSDLTYPLSDQREIQLNFHLESVKFLPPPGFVSTDPASYGAITQAAVSIPEIASARTQRAYCMAVTNDFSGERPSSWSSALDQICAGAMPGDSVDKEGNLPRRLFFVSAGNVPDFTDPSECSDLDEFPVEDPAQAWNAITVGGFTDKVEVSEADKLMGWTGLAQGGDHSPYSRISTDWNHSRTPIKPEIVFEAGNKAIRPDGNEILAGVDSLSLLTTGKNFVKEPLTTFWATSAATAQAAGMAAEIMKRHPSYWPETIRALLVHSAEWTPRMKARLKECKGTKKECIALARQFGYGVPNLARALQSAENDLALIAQADIQPFKKHSKLDSETNRESLSSPSLNEVHYYDIPWPKSALEDLSDKIVQMKVTLSYFIEPSPGENAPVTASRYQSHGLRFEVKRPGDTNAMFRQRVNRLEREDEVLPPAETDSRWLFGSNSVSAGSLHSDIWTGPAAELAARGLIAIYPVGGWWRSRLRLKRSESKTRYTLVVSILSEDVDIKLYTEIANRIRIETQVEI